MSFCDDIKNDEADIPADEITALLDYLDETISEKRAYLKKVHNALAELLLLVSEFDAISK